MFYSHSLIAFWKICRSIKSDLVLYVYKYDDLYFFKFDDLFLWNVSRASVNMSWLTQILIIFGILNHKHKHIYIYIYIIYKFLHLSRTLIIKEEYLFSIRLINYLTTLFYIYIKISFNNLICNLDIQKDTLQRCVLWFTKKLFLIMLTIIQVYIVRCL